MSFLLSDGAIKVIPDGEIHYHPGTEGSGTTIADQVGSADLTLTNDAWVTESAYEGGVGMDLDNANEYSATASLTQPTARTRIVRCRATSFGPDTSQIKYIWGHNFAPDCGYIESQSQWVYDDGGFNQQVNVSESPSSVTDSIRIIVTRMDSSTQYLGVYDKSRNLIGENSLSNPNTGYDSSTFYLGQQGQDRWWTGSADPNLETFNRYLSDSEIQTVLEERF